jgi:streptogramin lyase
MSRISTAGYDAKEDSQPNPLMVYFKEELAAYLAQVRGPGPSTLKPKPRPRPMGDETLAVIREYDVPQPGTGLPLFHDGSLWSEGAPGKLDLKNHHAIDGTLDFDGNVWFTDDVNSNPFRSVGKVDWRTGEVTNFKVSRSDGSELAANVHDIITDYNGIIWFGADGKLVRIEPRTGEMAFFTNPETKDVGGMMALDGKGGIWSPTSRFDPKTQTWKNFKNPVQKSMDGYAYTYGVAADKNGNGWASQYALDTMIKRNTETGESQNVKVPRYTRQAQELFTDDDRRIFELMGGATHQGRGVLGQYALRKPGAGPGPSDSVWGPGWWGETLVSIDINTSKITLHPFPWRVGAYQANVDKDGMVFVVFTDGDFIGKLNPKTEKWTRYDLPTVGTEAHGLQVVTVNGRTQVTAPYWAAGKTSKMEFRTREELQALKAEAKRMASAGGVQ